MHNDRRACFSLPAPSMSQTSRIAFFCTEELPEPAQLLARVIEALQPVRSIRSVSTSSRPSRSWEFLQRDIAGEDVDDEESEWRSVGTSLSNMNPRRVHEFYIPGGLMSIDFGPNIIDEMKWAVINGLPESVRGDRFVPINLAVRLGFHDLYEYLSDEYNQYFGRAFLSFNFWGYSTPVNGEAFRTQVFEVAAVVAVRRRLEGMVGRPLQQCFSSEI